jgi:cell division protein FtsB
MSAKQEALRREWYYRELKATLYQLDKHRAQLDEQRAELVKEIEALRAEINQDEGESQS